MAEAQPDLLRQAAAWLAAAGAIGALGVVAGALGAHGLESRLGPRALEQWRLAAHYQLLHAPVLAAASLWLRAGGRASPWVRAACWLLAAGIGMFSGSLDLLASSGSRALAWTTPVGGLSLVAGWACLAAAGVIGLRR